MGSKKFSALELDAIGEVLNISLGSSATALSTMLSSRVDITTPVVKVVSEEEFQLGNVDPAVGVEITYVEGLSGKNIMLLKRSDVKAIVEILMYTEIPDEEFELNEMNISAVCEVMNQMMGASATALSEFLGKIVNISTPVAFDISDKEDFKKKYFTPEETMVTVGFSLKIEDKVESEFINVMPVDLAKSLVAAFLPEDMMENDGSDSAPEPAPAPAAPEPESSGGGRPLSQEEIEAMLAGGIPSEPAPAEPEPEPAGGGKSLSQAEIEALISGGVPSEPAPAPQPVQQAAPPPAMDMYQQPMAPVVMQPDPMLQQQLLQQQQLMNQMMQQMQSMQQQIASRPAEPKQIPARPVTHTQLEETVTVSGEQQENLELIMGVPLEVTVEIGRTRRLVKEILEYTKGSLVVLDKLAGEQVDLYVNGQCVAKGDVVVVDDNFGVRITEVLRRPEL